MALPSLAVECELCDEWSMDETGTAFEFRLRTDVRWQDIQPVDGRILTSDDIAFSYDRQRQEGWPNAPLLHLVRDLNTPRPDVIQIGLAGPDADFLASLADGRSKIVAQEAVAVHGDLKSGPSVGTGPWILTASQSGEGHRFERNPGYFDSPFPFLDNLVFHVLSDPETRDAAFRVGMVDVHQISPGEWDGFRQQLPGAPFLLTRNPGIGLELGLNTGAPPLDDVRVRRAIFQAINPWQAIDEVWGEAAFVSLGVPVVEADWLLAEEEIRGYAGNQEEARNLLKETGLVLPVQVEIKIGDFGEPYRAHAALIADEMSDVGFDPTLVLVNRREYGDSVWLGGDYQMFVGPIAPVATPNGYLLPILHSQGVWNTTGHRDVELDRLIEAQAVDQDPARRRGAILDIQRLALGNAYRFMPATSASIWAWWPRVQGFHPNFAGFEYAHWARVWLEE